MLQCYLIVIDQGMSAPDHGKEVVDSLNAIYKRYIYKLMSNVQLKVSKIFDSYILISSFTENNDVSLSKQPPKYLSKEHHKHGVIYQGKYRKRVSKRKLTDREYHVQDNSDVAHKDMKMYFNTS